MNSIEIPSLETALKNYPLNPQADGQIIDPIVKKVYCYYDVSCCWEFLVTKFYRDGRSLGFVYNPMWGCHWLNIDPDNILKDDDADTIIKDYDFFRVPKPFSKYFPHGFGQRDKELRKYNLRIARECQQFPYKPKP